LDALIDRLAAAKEINAELERLMSDYMPFIIKSTKAAGEIGIEYEDMLSLAMLTFMNSVRQYDAEKGNFIAFAAACIRNRMIDESRKQMRHAGKVVPLSPDEEAVGETAEDRAAIAAYNLEQEQVSLSDEIEVFSEQLKDFGVSFQDLPRICPKQERARKQCISIGLFVSENAEMRKNLLKNRRLAQGELAARFGLSEKTIEKHRKYIVTIVILVVGDYPLIRAFLPKYSMDKEV
jgi:RNA polymerase sigma factor